jgi:hypothetical protein
MIVHNKLYYHTYNVLRNDLVVAPGVYPHRKMEGQLSQRTFRPPEQEKPVEAVDDKYKNIPKSRYRSFNLPSWYEDAPFQYNRRVLLGLIPGAILLGITEGAKYVCVVFSVFSSLLLFIIETRDYCSCNAIYCDFSPACLRLSLRLFLWFCWFIKVEGTGSE